MIQYATYLVMSSLQSKFSPSFRSDVKSHLPHSSSIGKGLLRRAQNRLSTSSRAHLSRKLRARMMFPRISSGRELRMQPALVAFCVLAESSMMMKR